MSISALLSPVLTGEPFAGSGPWNLWVCTNPRWQGPALSQIEHQVGMKCPSQQAPSQRLTDKSCLWEAAWLCRRKFCAMTQCTFPASSAHGETVYSAGSETQGAVVRHRVASAQGRMGNGTVLPVRNPEEAGLLSLAVDVGHRCLLYRQTLPWCFGEGEDHVADIYTPGTPC